MDGRPALNENLVFKPWEVDEAWGERMREEHEKAYKYFARRYEEGHGEPPNEEIKQLHQYAFVQGRDSIIKQDWGFFKEVRVTIERVPADPVIENDFTRLQRKKAIKEFESILAGIRIV